MQTDEAFLAHLSALPCGAARVSACRTYKADAFGVNSSLKTGVDVDTVLVKVLLSACRAKPRHPVTLYRMTAVGEFLCEVSRIHHKVLVYPAFFSSSLSEDYVMRKFWPNAISPLLLQVEVPADFPIALIEWAGPLGEGERLLGPRCEFRMIEEPEPAHSPNGKEYLRLRLAAQPASAATECRPRRVVRVR